MITRDHTHFRGPKRKRPGARTLGRFETIANVVARYGVQVDVSALKF